ncbi:MAG: hypothetical protein NTX76_05600 [Alphaproteobacteria bacterium]|nr:hypothetical protein [Alphaproteobacteria bacterium]
MGQFIKKYVCCLLVGGILNSAVMGSMAQAMDCLPTDCFTGNQHRPKINQIVPFTPSPVVVPAIKSRDDVGVLLSPDHPLPSNSSLLSSAPLPSPSSSLPSSRGLTTGSTSPHTDEVRLEILPKPARIGFARSSVSALHDQHGITQDKLDEFSKYWQAFSEVEDATKHHSMTRRWCTLSLSFLFGSFCATQGMNLALYQKLGPLLGLEHYYPMTAQSANETLFSYGLATWGLLVYTLSGWRQSTTGFKQMFYSSGHYLGVSTEDNNSRFYKLLRSAVLVGSIGSAVVPAIYAHLKAYDQLKDVSDPVVDAVILINSFIGVSWYCSSVYHDILTHSIQQKLNEQFWKNTYVAGLRTTLSWGIGNAITNFLALLDADKKEFHHQIFGISQDDANPQENIYKDLENLYHIVHFGRQYSSIHPNQEEPQLRKVVRYASHAFSWVFGAVGGIYAYTATKSMVSEYAHSVSDSWSMALSAGATLAYAIVKKSISRGIVTKHLTGIYDWYFDYQPREVDFSRNHQPISPFMKTINHLGGLTVGSSLVFSAKEVLPSTLQIPGMIVAGIGEGLFWSSILNKWQPVGINKIKECSYQTECLKPYMGSPDDDVSFMTFQVIEYLTKMGKSIETMPDELIRTHFGLIQTYMDKKEEAAEAAEDDEKLVHCVT